MRVIAAALAALSMTACYGRATPETCHAKYVRDGKGDAVRDNYEACLSRARAREMGLPPDVAELGTQLGFQTGCGDVRLRVFEWTGGKATTVGADACGRRLTYHRELRRHFGMRSARNVQWELVGDSAAIPLQAAPAVQVNNVYAPSSAQPPQ